MVVQEHSATLPCKLTMAPFIDFLKKPIKVNQQNCNAGTAKDNPFTSPWPFNFPTPKGGTWFDVWLTVYWNCLDADEEDCESGCISEEIHRRDYVK
jgi:hypothetical protein